MDNVTPKENASLSVVIASYREYILSAYAEQKHIVEIRVDTPPDGTPRLNEIYVGKVSAVKEGINAAFIDIAPGKTCYYDLKELPNAIFTTKYSKKPIAVGDELLVQVSREALKTKLPAVTTNLSFYSKNLVLTTGRKCLGISSKLDAAKKQLLQQLLEGYITEDYGFVIRTNAGQIEEKQIILEIERLIRQYQDVIPYAATRKCYSLIRRGAYEYENLLRDTRTDQISDIVTDDPVILEEVKAYLESNMPECLSKLRLYKDPLLPLYKLYSLEQVIRNTVKEQVWMRSGAYLVIQPTEALTVIDVNSGKADTQKKKEQIKKINLEAAAELAVQLRIRNLSGIILVDFINMESESDRLQVTEYLKQLLQKDPVQTHYIDTTGLQLAEITRKKVRKPLRDYIYILKEN